MGLVLAMDKKWLLRLKSLPFNASHRRASLDARCLKLAHFELQVGQLNLESPELPLL